MHFIGIVRSEPVTLMHVCVSSLLSVTSAVSQLMGSLDSLMLNAAHPVLGRIVSGGLGGGRGTLNHKGASFLLLCENISITDVLFGCKLPRLYDYKEKKSHE